MSSSVDYNYLSPSCGLKVSNVCFGGYTFGQGVYKTPGQVNEEDGHKLLDRFAELGGNFIDTAINYSNGKSEEIVGSWLSKNDRDRFVIATKCFNPLISPMAPNDPNRCGLNRKNVINSVEGSLKRLQTDYIDLYQMHYCDYGTPIEEICQTFHDLVRCGKVRHIGVSNATGWQLQKLVDYSKFMGLEKFITLQGQYNLMSRGLDVEVKEVCLNEGLGITAWSPLKGGLLTGKISRDSVAPPENTRLHYVIEDPASRSFEAAPYIEDLRNDEKFWSLMDKVQSIAEDKNKTVAQVSIRWVIQSKGVTSTIFGAKTMQQLESNMVASKGWELSQEEMDSLNEMTQLEPPSYPYGFIKKRMSFLQRYK